MPNDDPATSSRSGNQARQSSSSRPSGASQGGSGNEALLTVRGLTLRRDDGEGSAIFDNISLDVYPNEILILKGRSGAGKTTLLKCLAELNVYHKGEIRFKGKLPSDFGIPNFRTRVLYVPQRPSLLPGTPRDFLNQLLTFGTRSGTNREEAFQRCSALTKEWRLDGILWTREWATLSGGEGQRMALAIATGIGGAEVVLLDEPTSALDEETMQIVEKSLKNMLPGGDQHNGTLKALVWITHSTKQAERIGTRTFDITAD